MPSVACPPEEEGGGAEGWRGKDLVYSSGLVVWLLRLVWSNIIRGQQQQLAGKGKFFGGLVSLVA